MPITGGTNQLLQKHVQAMPLEKSILTFQEPVFHFLATANNMERRKTTVEVLKKVQQCNIGYLSNLHRLRAGH